MVSPKERMKYWRDFRETLPGLDTREQIRRTIDCWYSWPIQDRYLDMDDAENWPTPWELINDASICYLGRLYLLIETLHLSDPTNWTRDRFRFLYIKDDSASEMYPVVIIDNEYVIRSDVYEIQSYGVNIKESTILVNFTKVLYN